MTLWLEWRWRKGENVYEVCSIHDYSEGMLFFTLPLRMSLRGACSPRRGNLPSRMRPSPLSKRIQTGGKIATTGMEQVRRSRNDI